MSHTCPVCTESLTISTTGNSYLCSNQHQFDVAKQGYLNLLPVQHKNSKNPGDNKAMMNARRDFLEAGYYQNLADGVITLIENHLKRPSSICMLDLGCGEGYYSRHIGHHFNEKRPLIQYGVDISKTAIAAAAKKQPKARFAVASVNRLPYPDQHFDLILQIFAPSSLEEISRVLKPGGLLLTVTPGPRHLLQIKQFIYAEVKDHQSDKAPPEGFKELDRLRIHQNIIPNQEHRLALLQMTPFTWRITDQARLALQESGELDIETDFILSLSRKPR